MIKRSNENLSLRPEIDVGDILELFDCQIFSRKIITKKSIC